MIWPAEDMLRLMCMANAQTLATLPAVSNEFSKHFGASVKLARDSKGDAKALELEQTCASLEALIGTALEVPATQEKSEKAAAAAAPSMVPPENWNAAWQNMRALEADMHTDMWHVYAPDWEVHPGKLISKKGTWCKRTTQFSWETKEVARLYMPHGVVMPCLQISSIKDKKELARHDWVSQHLRVWLRPSIVRTLEARRGIWFVYWPHWQDEGTAIVAINDTWLKRTTQMSGELQPFELIYVPKGQRVKMLREAEIVGESEPWERYRHAHVHQHRRIMVAAPPLTVKRDKYDVFVGQGNATSMHGV
jgi:hypothetical protein